MALDPSTFAPQGDASVPLDQFTATFDEGIRNADSQLQLAQARYKQAQSAVSAIDPNKITNQDALKAAQDELAKSATVAENAAAQLTRAHELKAAAIERYSQRANISPALQDRYQAMADVERANAQQKLAENFEFLNAIPDKRAQLHATAQEAQANAAVAQAKAEVAGATTGIEKQAAQTRLDQANASLQTTQLANTRAGLENKITAATAAVAPRVAEAGAATAESKAKEAAATAGVAPDMAQAALAKAQADAAAAQLAVQSTQAQLDATTDADRRRAIQLDLSQKQAALDTANQQLDAARQLLPLSVAQAGANVATTQQNLQKGALGPLYGLQDRIKAIGDALRSGQITDPAQAQQQLQNYIQTTIAGTTPYEAQTTALGALNTQRGQDFALAESQGSTFGSGFGTALGQFSKLNETTPVGSDAAGRGFLASMDLLGDRLKSFAPQANPLSSALVQSMAGLGGVSTPAAPAAASAPTTTIQPDGTVTIQHTSAPTAAGLLPPGAAGTGADPNVAGSPALPAMLNASSPALPNHVSDLWANDPNLNPDSSGQGVAPRSMAGVT